MAAFCSSPLEAFRGWADWARSQGCRGATVDLVVCCQHSADEALEAMRDLMQRLKLPLNERKTAFAESQARLLILWATECRRLGLGLKSPRTAEERGGPEPYATPG